MGDFGYIFGYSLFFVFFLGGIVGWIVAERKRKMTEETRKEIEKDLSVIKKFSGYSERTGVCFYCGSDMRAKNSSICDDCIHFAGGKGSEPCDTCELTATNKETK